MTIEDAIARRVAAAMKEATKPLEKEVARLAKEVAKLAEIARATNETFDPRERLISQKEARIRLGVSADKVRQLVEMGTLLTANTPNGRKKIVESSLNRYIKGLQEAHERAV